MKFLVIGCGSIGQRHVTNLKTVSAESAIDVFDTQTELAKEIAKNHNVNLVNSTAIESGNYDCVLVCTPPSSHVDLAIRAVTSGSNVFIEKPLSSSLDGIEKLQNLVTKNNLLAFVGYNFRFNKGINTVKQLITDQTFGKVLYASAYFGQYLPDWRPNQDYRKGYIVNKSMGGGIILDGSHEIDYLMWLLGKPISIQSDYVYTDLLAADTEAIADVILKFHDKILGHIHMDFVRRKYKRTLELICEKGMVQWSLSESTIDTFDGIKKTHNRLEIKDTVDDMYVKEIEHVIDCIAKKSASKIIGLDNGIYTLKASNAIKESGVSGKRIIL